MVKPTDAVIGPPGAPRPEAAGGAAEGGGPGGMDMDMIRRMQQLMKDTLHLEYQLDVIDYTRRNFVHADMDAESFAKMQQDRGETFEMMILQQFMRAMSGAGEEEAPNPADALGQDPKQMLRDAIRLLTRPDMERQIKLFVARQLDTMDDQLTGDMPGMTVILTERNKVAMKVLADTVAAGRRRISLFYGAAHMPDLARRLREMGFQPVRTEWQMAWDLRIRHDQPSAIEELLMEAVDGLEALEIE